MNPACSRSTLSLAAEYAVGSELCRRGIYAQLTLGHQKKTDLLVFAESGGLARNEVKAKQGPTWPNCRGIAGRGAFLVFVDYQGCDLEQRPRFYVLSAADWRRVLEKRVADVESRHPEKRIEITDENVAVFVDEVDRNGKPYQGMGIRPSDLAAFADCWAKIFRAVQSR